MAAAAATARRPWRRTGLSGAAAAALGVIVFVACVASSSCGSTSAASAERQPDLRSGSDPHPGSAPAPHRLRSTRSTTHPAAGGGPHPRGTSRPGLLLPSCEAVVEKVEHETLELLRDAAQAHSQALRDKTTYRYLRQHKMHPPEDQYEREAFSTELSLEELERRVDEAQGALVAIESKISTVAGKLRAEGKLPDALTDTVLRACAGGRLNPRAFESRPRVSIMLQYWQRPHNIRKFIERFGACNTPEVPLELLVNIDNPEDHELWANASWDTKGMVVPVFSYNVHEIRAYNRLASMARGDYLFLVGDDDLPFQDTKTGQVDCSWLHNSVKIMDRWPHIGVLGVRNYVTCYDLQYQKYDDSNRGEWFKDPLLNLTLQWVQWVDMAPMAVRAAAWRHVGGMDETMSEVHTCGILSDWELCFRMWMSGWQVASTLQARLDVDKTQGGTHTSINTQKCWTRQHYIAGAVFHAKTDYALRKEICNRAQELTLTHAVLREPGMCPYPTPCVLPAVPWSSSDVAQGPGTPRPAPKTA